MVERGLPVSTAEELLGAPEDVRGQLVDQALAERWDQVRARDVVRGPDTATQGKHRSAAGGHQLRVRRQTRDALAAELSRPRGFTRVVREFHQQLMGVRAYLTDSDRAALRALFRDLVLLARASSTERAASPVLPPPTPTPAGRRRR